MRKSSWDSHISHLSTGMVLSHHHHHHHHHHHQITITITIITILSRSGSNVPIVLSLGQTAEDDFKEDDWKRLEAEMIIADRKGWSKWSRWSLPTQGYNKQLKQNCHWSKSKTNANDQVQKHTTVQVANFLLLQNLLQILTFEKFCPNSYQWNMLWILCSKLLVCWEKAWDSIKFQQKSVEVHTLPAVCQWANHAKVWKPDLFCKIWFLAKGAAKVIAKAISDVFWYQVTILIDWPFLNVAWYQGGSHRLCSVIATRYGGLYKLSLQRVVIFVKIFCLQRHWCWIIVTKDWTYVGDAFCMKCSRVPKKKGTWQQMWNVGTSSSQKRRQP